MKANRFFLPTALFCLALFTVSCSKQSLEETGPSPEKAFQAEYITGNTLNDDNTTADNGSTAQTNVSTTTKGTASPGGDSASDDKAIQGSINSAGNVLSTGIETADDYGFTTPDKPKMTRLEQSPFTTREAKKPAGNDFQTTSTLKKKNLGKQKAADRYFNKQ